jgi:CPA2 family monovalent cation:H+ antiporter-2
LRCWPSSWLIVGIASRLLGSSPGTALRSGLWLCAGGEFGFVILARSGDVGLLGIGELQPVLAAMVLSLLLAPLIVHFSDRWCSASSPRNGCCARCS